MNPSEADPVSLSPGDMEALGQLFEEHRPRLLAMLRRRIDPALSARVDAEDVLSEAFLLARRRWLALGGLPDMTPYAWLYRQALDALIELWRREMRALRDPGREMPWPEQSSVQLGLRLAAPQPSP